MKTTLATTFQEVTERLQSLKGDAQATHNEADFLLLDALLIAGHSEVVQAYLDAKKLHNFDY